MWTTTRLLSSDCWSLFTGPNVNIFFPLWFKQEHRIRHRRSTDREKTKWPRPSHHRRRQGHDNSRAKKPKSYLIFSRIQHICERHFYKYPGQKTHIVAKGEIAHDERVLLCIWCFHESYAADVSACWNWWTTWKRIYLIICLFFTNSLIFIDQSRQHLHP